MAGCNCSAVFTLVTPKLLPPTLGLTKQGRPVLLIILPSFTGSVFRRTTEFATLTPKLFKY